MDMEDEAGIYPRIELYRIRARMSSHDVCLPPFQLASPQGLESRHKPGATRYA